MAGQESPANGGYEASEPALRVRKDLFPSLRLPKLAGDVEADTDAEDSQPDLLESVSCVNLETDFEKSIDDIANQKLQGNGVLSPPERSHPRSRHRKHKQHSRHNSHSHGDQSPPNGCLPQKKKKKRSRHNHSPANNAVTLHVNGGKNLNLVSSSECQAEEQDGEEDSSEDEVLKFSVKLPLINVMRQSGKPYSHELSQLSTKKSKSKDSVKERRTHAVTPCSRKPRSMLDICSSKSKKKSKKSDSAPTYHSQIVDTNTIKIKIRRSVHETVS